MLHKLIVELEYCFFQCVYGLKTVLVSRQATRNGFHIIYVRCHELMHDKLNVYHDHLK